MASQVWKEAGGSAAVLVGVLDELLDREAGKLLELLVDVRVEGLLGDEVPVRAEVDAVVDPRLLVSGVAGALPDGGLGAVVDQSPLAVDDRERLALRQRRHVGVQLGVEVVLDLVVVGRHGSRTQELVRPGDDERVVHCLVLGGEDDPRDHARCTFRGAVGGGRVGDDRLRDRRVGDVGREP